MNIVESGNMLRIYGEYIINCELKEIILEQGKRGSRDSAIMHKFVVYLFDRSASSLYNKRQNNA